MLNRQAQREHRPTLWAVRRCQRAAVRLSQVPRDRQSQPAAAFRAAARAVRPVETLENVRQRLLRDARAAVVHADLHPARITVQSDDDLALLRGKAQRIREQVVQDLLHPHRVELRPIAL